MYKQEEISNIILSYSSEGFIFCNSSGVIEYVNLRIETLTGWKESDLKGKELSKVCLLPESSNVDSEEDILHSTTILVLKNDGKKISLPARTIKIKHQDKFMGLLVILQIESNKNSNVDRAQMEFVSTVSHELRTPLTSIKGFADTLIRSWDKVQEDVKKKYIIIIKEQADRLTRLVEDLLAVSRLESHKVNMTVRAVNLERIVNRVCDSLSTKIDKHIIVKNVENDLPNVSVDPDKLEQILTNLIDNAIKYSPNGGEVKILANSFFDKKDNLRKIKIDISDKGIGIGENDLPKIFTKFGRLDNPLTRNTQGTGLGLFITKSLVLSLKGEITVKSGKDGTTFSVTLPAAISEEAIPIGSSENNKGKLL